MSGSGPEATGVARTAGRVGSALGSLRVNRRGAFGLLGGAAAAVGAAAWAGPLLLPEQAVASIGDPANLYLAGTDGWIHLPATPKIGVFHPDVLVAPVRAVKRS